ncbi:hypothetical protein Dimus_015983, partial [Dionaea muscipula]
DFVIMDILEGTSLILRRPFIFTGETIFDCKNGEITLHIGEDVARFNIFDTMKHPHDEAAYVFDDSDNQSHYDYLDSVASLEALIESPWEPSSGISLAVPRVILR